MKVTQERGLTERPATCPSPRPAALPVEERAGGVLPGPVYPGGTAVMAAVQGAAADEAAQGAGGRGVAESL